MQWRSLGSGMVMGKVGLVFGRSESKEGEMAIRGREMKG